jgi:hypothetical protein
VLTTNCGKIFAALCKFFTVANQLGIATMMLFEMNQIVMLFEIPKNICKCEWLVNTVLGW